MTVSNIKSDRVSGRDLIINIFKLATLYNAVNMGWIVTRINCNTFELTKQINNNKELEEYKNLDLKAFICLLIN
jgi:hypothetical protein